MIFQNALANQGYIWHQSILFVLEVQTVGYEAGLQGSRVVSHILLYLFLYNSKFRNLML